MPEQIWCHQEIQKSLETLSRDFFVGGKTLLVLPDTDPDNPRFNELARGILARLASFRQNVTVAGFTVDGTDAVTRRNARFVFRHVQPLKIRDRGIFGQGFKAINPEIDQIGLMEDVLSCDVIVLAGLLKPSPSFGVSGLISLVTTVLPTATLARARLSNQSKALAEIFAFSLLPRTVFSFVLTPNNCFTGCDPVAVESYATRACRIPLKADRLLSESARLDLGDPFFCQTSISGNPNPDCVKAAKTGKKPVLDMARCNLCLDCLEVCPNDSICRTGERIAINSLCVRCGACIDVCPQWALG